MEAIVSIYRLKEEQAGVMPISPFPPFSAKSLLISEGSSQILPRHGVFF